MGLERSFSQASPHQVFGLLAAFRLDVKGNVLSDPNVGQLTKPHVGKVVGYSLALWVKQSGQRKNVDGGVEYHVALFLEKSAV